MSKRIMITRRGYCTIPGNLTDEEALVYAKVHLSPDDFDWEKPTLDTLEVAGTDYNENNAKTDTTGFLEAVIVTLVRTRLEDPFHPEVYTDNFVLFVPHDTTDVKAYAEKTFRAAAHYMLTDEHAGELIRESCSDFNWGDWVMCLSKKTEDEFGLYDCGSVPDSMRYLKLNHAQHIDLQVNQDECLLEDEAPCTLILHVGKESAMVLAKADMSTGAVYPDEEGPDPEQYEAADALFISFRDNARIPVAKHAEDRKTNENPYFCLDI